jgi:lysophospholipase L1-like esterase
VDVARLRDRRPLDRRGDLATRRRRVIRDGWTARRALVRRGTIAVLVLAAVGCAAGEQRTHPPRIVCLGDSITAGVTRSVPPPEPPEVDPEGGYPGRLARRFAGRALVRGRALGGATVSRWLSPPSDPTTAPFWTYLVREYPDLPATPRPDARSLAMAVLAVDGPDVVVILLGINDLHAEAADGGPHIVDAVAERLRRLRAEVGTRVGTVLVSTLLPNHRDPAALRDALNDRIRTDHPDFVPLGERFTEAGWETLLGDEIHPNARGYATLADALGSELVRRGIVRDHGAP